MIAIFQNHIGKTLISISLMGVFSLIILRKCNPPPQDINLAEITFTKEGTASIFNANGKLLKVISIEIAETPAETQVGLMYREHMEPLQGMLFIFNQEEPRYFYMKNTIIPLDIIYLDKDLKVVSFHQNTTPMDESSLPSEVPAQYVLEINAGLMEKWGIKKGSYISFSRD